LAFLLWIKTRVSNICHQVTKRSKAIPRQKARLVSGFYYWCSGLPDGVFPPITPEFQAAFPLWLALPLDPIVVQSIAYCRDPKQPTHYLVSPPVMQLGLRLPNLIISLAPRRRLLKVLGLQWEHMLDNFLFEKQKPLEHRS